MEVTSEVAGILPVLSKLHTKYRAWGKLDSDHVQAPEFINHCIKRLKVKYIVLLAQHPVKAGSRALFGNPEKGQVRYCHPSSIHCKISKHKRSTLKIF